MSDKTPTDDLTALIKKGSSGDRAAALEVRRLYADKPAKFLDMVFSMERIARQAVGRAIAPEKDELGVEAHVARIEAMEARLAGPDPSPIEAMLAGRAATCWGDTHAIHALFMTVANDGKSRTKTVEHYDKMLTRAHDRLIKALKALAYVRKVDLNVMLTQVHNHGPTQTLVNAPEGTIGRLLGRRE